MDRIENIKRRFASGSRNCLECQEGWNKILLALDEKLNAIDPNYKILQIKEKFGTLRFYASCSSYLTQEQKDHFQICIENAEAATENICETCGSTAVFPQPKGISWLKTLCQPCQDKRREKNKADTLFFADPC